MAAESSTSVIQNCTVKGVTVTVIKPVVFGGLIGRNSEGRIEGCQVISGTINLNLSGAVILIMVAWLVSILMERLLL